MAESTTLNEVTNVIWIGPISQTFTSSDIVKAIGNNQVVIRHHGNYAFIDTYSASVAKGIIEDWNNGLFELPEGTKLQLAQSKRVSDTVWFGNLNGFRNGHEFIRQVDAVAKHRTYRFINHTNSAIVGFKNVHDATEVLNHMDGMRYGGFVVRTNYFHKKPDTVAYSRSSSPDSDCASLTYNTNCASLTYSRGCTPSGYKRKAPESEDQPLKRQKTTHDTPVPQTSPPVMINVMSIMSTCLQPARFSVEPKPNNPIEIDIKISGVYRMTVLASADELVGFQNGDNLDFTHYTTVPNMENLVMCLFPGQKRQARLYMAEEEDRFPYELIKQHCQVGVYFGAPAHSTYTIIRLKNINNSLVLLLD